MKEKKPLNIEIGDRIQQARETAGYTQERFAELIDVSVQYVSDLERGVVGTSIPTLIKICRVLAISSDYLLFGRDPETKQPLEITERIQKLTPTQQNIVEKSILVTLEAFSCQNVSEQK